MSATTALTERLGPTRDALRTWWRGLGKREQRGLQLAAVLVGVLLLWLLFIGPATQTLRRAPAEREALETQYQAMQALATEAQTLRAAPPVAPDAARAALEAAAARLGAKAKLNLQGGRAVVNLKGVGSAELGAFIAEARTGARARVAEATLTQASPGLYDGTLTVTLGNTGP